MPTLNDGGFELSSSVAQWAGNYADGWYYAPPVNGSWSLSTANPYNGSKHGRFTTSGSIGSTNLLFPVEISDPGVDVLSDVWPITGVAPAEGLTITGSAQMMISSFSGLVDDQALGFLQLRWWDAGGSQVGTGVNSTQQITDADTSYTLVSHTWTCPANAAYYSFNVVVQIDATTCVFDVDGVNTVFSTPSLYVTNTGFRFPHQRWD
jgi:hypothetical protein